MKILIVYLIILNNIYITEFVTGNNLSNSNETLSDRMKRYEHEIDGNLKIFPYESFIVKLDGRSFSKFTKKFYKPFDVVFIKAMCKTMIDLVKEFDVQTGYTHSDEITLIFDSKCSKLEYNNILADDEGKTHIKNHMFNGRIQKILTLISSFCSVRFNYHLDKLIEPIADNYDELLIAVIKLHYQMFDARILKFDENNKYEILNHQIWRSIFDCERNAISTYAYTYFGPKKIMNKNSTEMIEMLQKKNISWTYDVPTFIKHGIYCKKILVEHQIGENKITRSDYVCKELKINFSNDNLNMLFEKYWDNCNDKLDIDNLTIFIIKIQ